MTHYTLGLDLGSNSVGWAMIAREGETFADGSRIVAGVRIFPEGTDRKDLENEEPRGQQRRLARGQRRMVYRRRQRLHKLARILRGAGLLPAEREVLADLLKKEPYSLRAKGLDKELSLHEFGRVLMHLCRRRGFKSNRKTGKSKDDGRVAKETAALQKEIDAAGCRTLGEYLARLVPPDGDKNAHKTGDRVRRRVRGRYTLRPMYEHEFEMLWSAQAEKYKGRDPNPLTPGLKAQAYDAIFFQRPVWWDPATIGECELEPGEKRCPRAHWLGQRFRMLQEMNNLWCLDPSDGERPLRQDERRKLGQSLGQCAKMTFDEIRDLLGLLDSQTFNLEDQGKRKSLKGNEVEAAVRSALKKRFEGTPAEVLERMRDAVAGEEDADRLRSIAAQEWQLDPPEIDRLLRATLPEGNLRVSLKAIRKVLPYLEPDHVCDERCRRLFPEKHPYAGHVFSEAKELAGYTLTGQPGVLDRLPPVDAAVKHLTNPLVHRALTEVRKVVNALIREYAPKYGKPAEVVIELARDMKKPRGERETLHRENRQRAEENESIRATLQTEFGILSPKRDDVLRYRLWVEAGKRSPYSGDPVCQSKLFSGEVQVDHIFPYSRSLDDSYMNKTVCFVSENAEKGNRTPYEAFHDQPERYERLIQAARVLPYAKRRRFTQKTIDLNEFIKRQLNDTRYISRQAVRYLAHVVGDKQVRCVKGGTTAELRWQWGLEGLWPNAAERDGDHRRHAVDAMVVGLTTRAALQSLSAVKYNPAKPGFEAPWRHFRHEVEETWSAVNVSFRPTRRLGGALHEDTGLGSVEGKASRYVHRVPVASLTVAMVRQIRDPVIRSIVEVRCREKGVDLEGRGKVGKVLCDPPLRMASGVVIRRVRIETTEKTAIPIRNVGGKVAKAVLPGGNHHVEIYESINKIGETVWTGRCVSRFEAHQRLHHGRPVVDQNPADGVKFVMSLCINDMVLMTDSQTGEVGLFRVQKMSSGVPFLELRWHTAATIQDKATRYLIATWDKLRSCAARKVLVDPIGRLLPCHD